MFFNIKEKLKNGPRTVGNNSARGTQDTHPNSQSSRRSTQLKVKPLKAVSEKEKLMLKNIQITKDEGTAKSFLASFVFIRISLQFTGNIKSKGFLNNQEELT